VAPIGSVAQALALALAVALPAWSQVPPRAEFQGVGPRVTEAQWRDAFPFFTCADSVGMAGVERTCAFDLRQRAEAIRARCGDDAGDAAQRCVADTSRRVDAFAAFHGAELRDAYATFRDDHLVQVTASYDTAAYSQVLAGLTRVYGPAALSDDSVTNRRGTVLPNSIARWTLETGTLEIRRFSTTMDKAAFTLSAPQHGGGARRRHRDATAGDAGK